MDSLILRNTALQDGSISCLGTHVRIKDFKIKKKKEYWSGVPLPSLNN